ncbi:SubName: Full=Uncharacterized protein {ECO:0000313/EMBL:CCA70734.1} [Serendipita indica DSM 11827]|uniref:Uncharacterized protein n=1 Tax=Serendipita indica (strain DSM 11827) TaxID=1109443 RepID=G4THE1_SERID|nr:SubName: Full=Uncharacterized protein {ECO:0000313/EMBL:CCA70734.1} [Serendipita indica DSM 11827]CCA70734.1 hypothetical protein PIIN_04668 [Serendipita indica DSM 11827]
MANHSSTIDRLEKVYSALEHETTAALDESREFNNRARVQLAELSALMDALDNSNKRLEDNKRIAQTLIDVLPAYVAKVRDAETDFEDFERNFPILEKSVDVFYERSKETSEDIRRLREQVGTLTQRQEAFSSTYIAAPILLSVVFALILYAVQR